jgi:predicted permease
MLSDLRFAFRQLIKKPGFTAVVVLSLALGIGSSTTVFCWLQGVWLNPLPGVARQERMFILTPVRGTSPWQTCSLPDVHDIDTQKEIFAGVIASQVTPACLGVDAQSEWIYGQIATANFFDVLGVRALLGRTFLADEDQKPGGNAVLVLSETFWRRRFAADPSIIGRSVELNRHVFTVVGVVPAEFRGTMSGLVCDFWAPLSMHMEVMNSGSLTVREWRWLHTQARLQPGVNQERAQAALDLLSARLQQTYPDTNNSIFFKILRFSQAPYGVQPVLLPALTILLVVSFGVLLIVAANVADLLLARGSERQKEIAIRLAVGAGRSRLVRQLLIESLLLAALGGMAGILAAFWMVDLLQAMTPPTNLPTALTQAVDWKTLVFASTLTLGTGILFGLFPAWQCTRPDLNGALKEGGRGTSGGRSHRRLRQLLVVGEIALSLTLLVGAGLCIRSANRARQADLGLDPNRVLLAGLRIGMNGYNEQTGKVFYRQLQQRLSSLPGVESAGFASWFPLGFEGGASTDVHPAGYDEKTGENMSIRWVTVSPGYFSTIKVPLLSGREFTDHDDTDNTRVAVVNEAMALRYWPGQNAIGHTFRTGNTPRTVIGVVKTGKYQTLNEAPLPMFFTPYGQGINELNLGVAVRTQGDPSLFARTLRDEIHRLDPGVETWGVMPMKDYMKAAFTAPVLASRLLTAMGLVALALAAMGVYAVMAFAVGERMREFGLRMALGASPRELLTLVLKNGLTLAAWGVGLGLVLALGVTRLLASVLYDVTPFDPVTFFGVPSILATTAIVAALIPARRAMRADPCVSLRSE